MWMAYLKRSRALLPSCFLLLLTPCSGFVVDFGADDFERMVWNMVGLICDVAACGHGAFADTEDVAE